MTLPSALPTDPPTDPPTALQDQVRWLVDRAAVGDLLVEFARSLDEQDWAAHVALYLPDGTFRAGDALHLQGHDELWRTASPQGLGRYAGTWHLSANHAITVGVDGDPDRARTRSYLIGVHLLSSAPTDHADGGGWYDCTLRRTPQGWRFETVAITETWRAGQSLPHMAPPAPAPV